MMACRGKRYTAAKYIEDQEKLERHYMTGLMGMTLEEAQQLQL